MTGRKPIAVLQPFTALDFPGHLACILFFAGCSMRCDYCHNPGIVTDAGRFDFDAIEPFLLRRRGQLDGLVLSGGEATRWPEVVPIADRAKALGYAVKLDTNGLHPQRLRRLLAAGSLDAIALDVKAPEEQFRAVTGSRAWGAFCESLALVVGSAGRLTCEVRTTIHPAVLSLADLLALGDLLAKAGWDGPWVLQEVRCGPDQPTLRPLPPYAAFPGLEQLAAVPFSILLRQRDGSTRSLTPARLSPPLPPETEAYRNPLPPDNAGRA